MKKSILSIAFIAAAFGSASAWTDDPAKPVTAFPVGTIDYGCETKVCPDGSFWSVMYHPNLKNAGSEEDISNVVYEYRIQHFDADGNPTFKDPMGLLISDYKNLSYTVVNQYLLADADGNAIVAVADCRNSPDSGRSYTAYKISPEGKMLWSDEGVSISDPTKPSGVSAAMSMVQLEDKSIVFAWTEYPRGSMEAGIHMQRITADGTPQWDANTAGVTKEVASYPYLVNSGDNTFIMVYAKTASQVLYAKKLDFECESVWGKEVRIYRGGFGSIPLHLNLDVAPSGDGGVLASWCDDREGTNVESAYISYVTPEGKLGFTGQSDEADVKLSYEGWRNFTVSSCAANDGSGFYVAYRATSADQNYQGVAIQKISKKGDLLWSDNGGYVEPVELEKTYSYVTSQAAPNGGVMVFYQQYRNWFDQPCFVKQLDGNGSPVWENPRVQINSSNRLSSNLLSQPIPGKDAWLCDWKDGGTSETDKDPSNCINIVYSNGLIGSATSGIETVETPSSISYSDGSICGSFADGATVVAYQPTGKKVASAMFSNGSASLTLSPGLYLVSVQDKTVKIIVR